MTSVGREEELLLRSSAHGRRVASGGGPRGGGLTSLHICHTLTQGIPLRTIVDATFSSESVHRSTGAGLPQPIYSPFCNIYSIQSLYRGVEGRVKVQVEVQSAMFTTRVFARLCQAISDALLVTLTYLHYMLVSCLPALLKMGSYSSTTMCQYWDNRLIY